MLLHITFSILVLGEFLAGKMASDAAFLYPETRDDSGEVLCAASPPNRTLETVGKRVDCLTLCTQGCRSQCHAINYRETTQHCDIFYYEPCSYDQQPDCVNYQVDNSTRGVSINYGGCVFYCVGPL